MFAMFAYIGGSPPIYIERFHLSPPHYGMVFGLCAAAYILASQVNARILSRIAAGLVLRIAAWTALVATIVLTAASMAGADTLPLVVVCVFAMMFAMGFIMPNTTVGALSRHAPHAASASALMGTLGFSLGAVSGTLVGVLTDGTPRGMAALMLIGTIGVVVADAARPKNPPTPIPAAPPTTTEPEPEPTPLLNEVT